MSVDTSKFEGGFITSATMLVPSHTHIFPYWQSDNGPSAMWTALSLSSATNIGGSEIFDDDCRGALP